MQRMKLTLLFVLLSLVVQAQNFSVEGIPQDAPSSKLLNDQFKSFNIYKVDANVLSDYMQQNQNQSRLVFHLGDDFVWDLLLIPNDIRTSDYQVNYKTAEGLRRSENSINKTFNGYVQGAGGGTTALTVDHNFIYGFIEQNNEVFFIEPLHYFLPEAEKDLFVVYAQSDVKENKGHKCGADELEHNQRIMAERQQYPAENEEKSLLACFDLELAIASDFSMFTKYGSVAGVENHNIGVLNNVQTNYDDEFTHNVNFVVVTQFISSCSSCDEWTTSTDAGTLLESFTNWGNAGNFGVNFDNGEMWTNRNFNGGTVGIAWLNGLCNSVKYHCLQDFTSNANLLRVVTSHELGHNLSSGHDAGGSGFIMAPAVNNTNTWSAQSINTINSFVQGRINSGCLSPCSSGAPPVAAFNATIESGCVPLTVNFIDNSTDATSWLWTFENGMPNTSTQQNPSVTFNDVGTWDVSLQVSNAFGTNTISETDHITTTDVPEVAFEVFTTDLIASFTNNSINATSYSWDFGDGTTSTDANPAHIYDEDGEYVVILEAFNDCGSNFLIEVVVIITPPFALFSADQTLGCGPLTVQFFNESSSNSETWSWSFFNGSPSTSSEQNPLVIFNTPGIHDVELTVSNGAGINTYTELGFVEVLPQPTIDFTYNVINDTEVQFINNSTNADSYLWDFGDGNTSTEASPTHIYAGSGNYSVVLIVINVCDQLSIVTDIEITAPVAPIAGFQADLFSGCAGFTVSFMDLSSDAVSWNWTFAGGTPSTSAEENPSVVYNTPGNYDVTLTVTNAIGTDVLTEVAYITVEDTPTADFSNSTNGMDADFTNASTEATSYSWDFGDGNTSTDENPSNTYNADGTYIVELTATNACGTDVTTQEVVISNAPTAGFNSDITNGCADLTVEFSDASSANATTWNWVFTGGTPSTSTDPNPTVVYNTAGTYEVELTVGNFDGLTSTVTQTSYITVEDVPTADFSNSTNGMDADFTNASTDATSYSWDFGDGNTSTDESPSNTYNADGTYTVELTATNACGTDVTTQEVVISNAPTAGFNSDITNGCADLTVEFSDASSANAITWNWTFEGGTPSTSTDPNPTVVYNTAGTYEVELTVGNFDGLTSTVTQTSYITVEDVPTADFSNSTNGMDADFTNASTDATSYSWDFGDGNTSTDESPSNTYNADGTYTVELTATNACGTDITTQEVVISNAPTAGFNSDITNGCADLTVEFSDASSANATTWNWVFTGGTPSTSTDPNPTVVYNTAGTYEVELTVGNFDGLTSTVTQTSYITVEDVPTADFSNSTNGMDADFTNASTDATSYSWDFGDGNTSTDESPSNTYNADGTYTVELTATNACGTDITTQEVVISNAPTAGFNSDITNGCADLTVEFSDASSANATTWNWVFTGGTPSTSTDPNPTVVYNTAGTYEVELTVGNFDGLTSTVTQTSYITVEDVPTADFSNSTNGMDTDFTNASTDATSYSWDFGDGNTSTDESPSNTYNADGTYIVELTATNACGTDVTTQEVVISNAPTAGFNSDITNGCADLTVEFSDASSANATTWNWVFTGGTPSTSTDPNPTVVYNTAGTYEVELTVGNFDGLTSTVTQTSYITVEDVPTADFSNSTNGMDTDFTNASTDATSYSWDFGDGNTSTDESPSNTYNADGTYIVELTAANACGTDVTTQEVVISNAPTAGFNSDITNGCADLTVEFSDASSANATTWSWTFEGGTPSISTDPNPTVVYNTAGTYEVELTVGNFEGLTSTVTQTSYITVEDVPTADFSNSTNGMDADFTNASTDATSYSWDFGDGNTSTDENPSNTYNADGTYTVEFTATNACGTDVTTQEVVISNAPTAGFDSDITNGCADLTVEFSDASSANATTWNWTFEGGTPSTSTDPNPTVVYNTAGTYEVELTVGNFDGLTSTVTQTSYITVEDVPTADFSNSTNGALVDFSNASANATTYSWAFGDGNMSTATNPTHTYNTDGVYMVTLASTNDCGSVTVTETVIIVTPPSAAFVADVTTGCSPLTVNFTDQSSENTTEWLWTFEGGTPATSTSQNPAVVFSTAGSYGVTLVVTNAAGSNTSSQTSYIVVNEEPTAGFTSTQTMSTFDFNNTSSNATSYNWNFGDGNTSTQINPSHSYIVAGTFTVILTATNECGSVTSTETVVVEAAPSVAFTASVTSGCAPLVVNFSDLSMGNITSWNWTFDGLTPPFSSEQNPVVIYETPGIYSVTLEATTAGGTESFTQTGYITVLAGPTAGFTTSGGGADYDFSNSSTDGDAYAWDFGDGMSSTAENPSHSYTATGIYTVSLTTSNACGSATTTEVITVTVEVPPVAGFTADINEGCAPLVVNYANQSSGNTTNLLWSFEGGIPATSTDTNPQVTYGLPGTYNVTLTASNDAGENTAIQNSYIVVTEAAPLSSFNSTIVASDVSFENTSSGATTFAWNFGDGNTSTMENPSHTYMNDGTYQVTLMVMNGCGPSEITETIVIATVPDAAFSMDVNTGCGPLAVSFTDESSDNTVSWAWEFPGGTPATSTAQNPMVSYATAGTYDVTLVVTNAQGDDTAVQSGSIVIEDVPMAAFSFSGSDAMIDFTNGSTAGTSYDWDFGDGNMSSMENPMHLYMEDGIYEVTLLVTNDCGTSVVVETVVIATLPVAGFTMDVSTGCAPLEVNFTDASSSNTDSWAWEFPGATPATSTDQNPVVSYDAPGTYDVTLVVTNGQGIDTEMQTSSIIIDAMPLAGFGYGVFDLLVDFSNSSISGSTYEWSFGDGSMSMDENPSHTYMTGGDFEVQLIVTNGCGMDTITQTVMIDGMAPIAAFEGTPIPGCVPLTVNFTDQSTGANTWVWTFDGGNPGTSSEQNPVVDYDTPGTYPVTLSVSNPFGSNSITQVGYVVVETLPVANFEFAIDADQVNFTNLSSGGGTWLWEFGDGETSTFENPQHVYTQSGDYEVTLTVTNDCGTHVYSKVVSVIIISTTLPEDVNAFSLYPNPNNGSFYLEIDANPTDELRVQLYDVIGRRMMSRNFDFTSGQLKERFDVGDLAAGTYVLELNLGGSLIVRKVVVK